MHGVARQDAASIHNKKNVDERFRARTQQMRRCARQARLHLPCWSRLAYSVCQRGLYQPAESAVEQGRTVGETAWFSNWNPLVFHDFDRFLRWPRFPQSQTREKFPYN